MSKRFLMIDSRVPDPLLLEHASPGEHRRSEATGISSGVEVKS